MDFKIATVIFRQGYLLRFVVPTSYLWKT